MASSSTPRPGRRTLRVALVLLGIAVGLTFMVACRSLSKPELEVRLRALSKNAALGPLERLTFTADLGDGREELELVYHHAPAVERADAVPVVLVHGTPSTLFSWTELIYGTPASADHAGFDGLRQARDVYALEVIGHGIAPGAHAPYTFERCARFVAEAMRALGLERVHLVGSSYGGEFAWRAALLAPERVASLVLIDSSGLPRRDDDWLPEEVQMRENSLAKIGWLLNSRERIEGALAPHFREIPPDRVEEFYLVCANAPNWKAMVDLARDENGLGADGLAELRIPTLVLWGEDDVAYAADHYGRGLAERLPDAEFTTLPATGHYPHEERPAEVVRVLAGFFERHGSTP